MMKVNMHNRTMVMLNNPVTVYTSYRGSQQTSREHSSSFVLAELESLLQKK